MYIVIFVCGFCGFGQNKTIVHVVGPTELPTISTVHNNARHVIVVFLEIIKLVIFKHNGGARETCRVVYCAEALLKRYCWW